VTDPTELGTRLGREWAQERIKEVIGDVEEWDRDEFSPPTNEVQDIGEDTVEWDELCLAARKSYQRHVAAVIAANEGDSP
jgi:hypothetical protein